jgi:hypothetical protein
MRRNIILISFKKVELSWFLKIKMKSTICPLNWKNKRES